MELVVYQTTFCPGSPVGRFDVNLSNGDLAPSLKPSADQCWANMTSVSQRWATGPNDFNVGPTDDRGCMIGVLWGSFRVWFHFNGKPGVTVAIYSFDVHFLQSVWFIYDGVTTMVYRRWDSSITLPPISVIPVDVDWMTAVSARVVWKLSNQSTKKTPSENGNPNPRRTLKHPPIRTESCRGVGQESFFLSMWESLLREQ